MANIYLPIDQYCILTKSLLDIIINKKYTPTHIEIEVEDIYYYNFKNLMDYNLRFTYYDLLNNKGVNFERVKNFLTQENNLKFLSNKDYLHLSKEDLAYFRINEIHLIPTKESIDLLKQLINDRKAIEVDSGIGLIGDIIGIPSFDKKLFELKNPLLKEIDSFNTYVKVASRDTKKGYLISQVEMKAKKDTVEKLFDDFVHTKQNKKEFLNKNFQKQKSYAYIECSTELIGKQFMVDINNLGLFHNVNNELVIYINELIDYISSFTVIGEGSEIYAKAKQGDSGNVNLTGATHLLKTKLKICFQEGNEYSEFLLVSFLSYCFDIKKIASSFMKGTKEYPQTSHKNFKLTTYEETKIQDKKVSSFLSCFDSFILEQADTYYTMPFEDIYESVNKNSDDFLNVIQSILTKSNKKLSNEGIVQYFLNSPYGEFILSFTDVVDGRVDEDDYQWLLVQYENITRIITLFMKASIKYEYENRLIIPIKNTSLNTNDIKKLYNSLEKEFKVIKYPNRVQQKNYKEAIKQSVTHNQETLVIAYGDDFNYNQYKHMKKLDFVSIGSLDLFLKNDNYKGLKFALLQTNQLITSHDNPLKKLNAILYIKAKKSRFDLAEFVKNNDLKLIQSNILP